MFLCVSDSFKDREHSGIECVFPIVSCYLKDSNTQELRNGMCVPLVPCSFKDREHSGEECEFPIVSCVPRLGNNRKECFLPSDFPVVLTPCVTGCCLGAQCLLVDREDDLPVAGGEVELSVLEDVEEWDSQYSFDQTLSLLYRPWTVGVTSCCLWTQLIRTLIPCIR